MPTATPAQQDRFYIRVLLANVKGATSFEDLRTYKNTTYVFKNLIFHKKIKSIFRILTNSKRLRMNSFHKRSHNISTSRPTKSIIHNHFNTLE